MRAVTRYVANDGSEWTDKSRAIQRDEMIAEVNAIMATLKPHPTELNWKGFVQHSDESILAVKRQLFRVANCDGVLKWWIDDQKQSHGKTDESLICGTHPSWFGRMLDGSHDPLAKAYSRLCCIDSLGREFNQPFYANNPSEAELVCVG